jgi:Bax protein
MPRPAPKKQTFEWSAIAFTGFCVALLFALAASGRLGPSAKILKIEVSADQTIGGARYGGRIAAVVRKPVPVQYVTPPLNLQPLLEKMGYHLEDVRRYGDVPRLFLASLPPELQKIQQPRARKILFIKTALPLILHANEMILWDRKKILKLLDKSRNGKTVAPREQAWLNKKAQEYGLATPDLTELVRRIDIIPPSLVLAQAAEESGWGTSRFAHEGNAIFGQRTWRGNNGMKPARREEGKTFKVRAFNRLIDGIMSYTRNLNGHTAYDAFRRAREAQRRRGGVLDGYALATTLERYSERGSAYINTIQMLIRVNRMQAFDRARLSDQRVVELGSPDA